MRFPELVYRPKDVDFLTGSDVVQRRVRRIDTTGAVVVTSMIDSPVPNNRAFILTNVLLNGRAGAAQTVAQFGLDVVLEGGLIVSISGEFPTVAQQNRDHLWTGEYMLMPGEILQSFVAFSAGAAPNTGRMLYHGYVIPIGTLQLG